jgi:hypothetical protein
LSDDVDITKKQKQFGILAKKINLKKTEEEEKMKSEAFFYVKRNK